MLNLTCIMLEYLKDFALNAGANTVHLLLPFIYLQQK